MPEKQSTATGWLLAKLSGIFAPLIATIDYLRAIPLERWTYILGVIGGIGYLCILAYDFMRKRKEAKLVELQLKLAEQELAEHEAKR